MHVIGTAGHVDHGKKALVQAITGMDPDRLAEERERGLTIDLGFAWYTLSSGEEVSIVDVPGHERFIKNMLAGVGGIELALLVMAADEGPMPQTYEHLAILDRLEVPAGIVAITKSDLVEPDYLELVELETRDILAGSRLAEAPVHAVSALTGEGLPALLLAIERALAGAPPRRDVQRPRLPIDRVFTIQGFGTIVTGTLVDGPLEVGQEVALQPGAVRARIRGLQRHRTKVQRLEPGTRAAVNLSGISPDDVERGMVLALPASLSPATALDIRLTSTPVMRHPLQHDSVVTVLAGTAESQARVRLLDADRLEPGAACWAQLVLEAPLAVLPGDRCIVRTPNDTVAGGVVVALNPRRHRRFHAPTLATLALALDGSPKSRLLDRLASGPATAGGLAPAVALSPRELEAAIAEAVAAGDAIVDGTRVYASTWLASATGRLAGLAADYLAEHPLRRVAPREHLRSQARWESPVFDYVTAAALRSGLLVPDAQGALAPPGYAVQLPPRQRDAVARYLDALRAAPFSPPTDVPLDGELLAYLEAEGQVARTRAGVVYAREAMDEMVERTTGWCRDHGEISLAQVRDLFGTSRKYAQAFLEHLDEMRITRRVGDVRVLRGVN